MICPSSAPLNRQLLQLVAVTLQDGVPDSHVDMMIDGQRAEVNVRPRRKQDMRIKLEEMRASQLEAFEGRWRRCLREEDVQRVERAGPDNGEIAFELREARKRSKNAREIHGRTYHTENI